MNWFTELSQSVQYFFMIIFCIATIGILGLLFFVIKNHGKIKVGPVELDGDDDDGEVKK